MSARTARFLEADLKRAMSAAIKVGIREAGVEIAPDGTIAIIIGASAKLSGRRNTCDDLLD